MEEADSAVIPDLRARLLQQLVTPSQENRFGAPYLVRQIAGALKPEQPTYVVWEALWSLVADGLVYLDPAGQGNGTDNWQWRPSRLGIQVATSGTWEPRDPEGYLRRLKRRVPDLDQAAVTYLEEALRAFNSRCYLASSVMLGVASEQVFGRLAEAFVAASGDANGKLAALLKNPRATYNARFAELRKRLESERPTLPEGLADNLTMDAVADLLRLTRNAAGHPTGQSVDEETAYTHLQMASRYLAKMTDLAKHYEEGV